MEALHHQGGGTGGGAAGEQGRDPESGVENLRDSTDDHFVRRRVQPLCARPRAMWLYEGPSDSTRVDPTELSTSEIEKRVRVLTKFSSDDSPAYFPTAAAFSKDNPLHEVKTSSSLFYFGCLIVDLML